MQTVILKLCDTENGLYIDVSRMIKKGAMVVSYDIVAPNAGRAPINGVGYAGRVATKLTISCTCNPLVQSDTEILFPLIKQPYVYAEFIDPEIGHRSKVRMMTGNAPATAMLIQKINGVEVPTWDGIKFELQEV